MYERLFVVEIKYILCIERNELFKCYWQWIYILSVLMEYNGFMNLNRWCNRQIKMWRMHNLDLEKKISQIWIIKDKTKLELNLWL